MVQTKFLKENFRSQTELQDPFVWIEFFLNVQKKSKSVFPLVCPDVLFQSKIENLVEISKSKWQKLAINLAINRIFLPNSIEFSFDCQESDISCFVFKGRGVSLPICCTEELLKLWETVIFEFESAGIHYEIVYGSAIGAMKFRSVLPWELDGDLYYSTWNHSAIAKMNETFAEKGYKLANLKYSEDPECMGIQGPRKFYCGEFIIYSKHWRIQFQGALRLGSHIWPERPPTRLKIGKVWAATVPNPALHSRNTYEDDIFAHLEHQMYYGHQYGKHGTRPRFKKCMMKDEFHGCLDQFLPYGSLQFREKPWI